MFWQYNEKQAMRDGEWKLIRPSIREAMIVSLEDLDMDRRLKYEPEGITDICRDPEPERLVPPPQPPLLFNIENDPYEKNDLADQHPERASKMLRELETWFESVEAERRSIDD